MARPDGKHKREESATPHATRGEIAFAAWVLTAALFTASLPVLLGWLIRPPNTFFWAVPAQANYLDADQYLALTRQAVDSGPLVGDPYTTEPHAPRLLIPHILLQALLCHAFHWHPLLSYHLSRVLFGAMLLAAGAWLGFLLLLGSRERKIYLALLSFSTGAGWILSWGGIEIPNGDLFQPEGNTLHTLANLPHLSLSAALLTYLFGAALKWRTIEPSRRSRWVTGIVAAVVILSWSHPFDFVTLGLAIGCFGGYRWATERRFPTPLLSYGGFVGAGALPAAAYWVWLTQTDPVYRALASDALEVQGFWYYAIAHGPLLLAGIPALCDADRRRRIAPALCWAIPVFLFLILPLSLGGKQSRLLGGVHVPLALWAAAGLSMLIERKSTLARLFGWGMGAALCVGAGGLVLGNTSPYLRRGFDFYWQPQIRLLFHALAQKATPGDILLGGEYTGSWAPVEAPVRSYHGHWHMTLNEAEKRRERDRFFRAPLQPEVRARWLRRQGIRWIIYSPQEWPAGAQTPAGVPGVTPVYQSPTALLFRYDPPKAEELAR